ncbi:MAG: ABC transporter permease [Candidatus Cloacimonetes bacterium]|nr:ABC transporter permease [Candidatus Cloacimonadota bacterium]
MNKILLIKDLRLMLKDLKFQIFFLILVALFILSAVSGAIAHKSHSENFQKALNQHHDEIFDGTSTQLIRMLDTHVANLRVVPRPSPADLFSSYRAFPTKVYSIPTYYQPILGNIDLELQGSFQLNWYFILGILSGLFMLILSFETISREKSAGTLRLLSIYGFKRQAILWHKYVGYMLLYLVIIIPPALVSMVLFFGLTGTWSLFFMLRFLIIIMLSLPFASFFILLGIFLSMSKNSRNTIVMVLFVWLLFLIIIPQSANIIAKQIKPLKTTKEYTELRNDAWLTEYYVWIAEYGDSVILLVDLPAGFRARAVDASVEKMNQAYQTELQEALAQTKLIQNIASISPFMQFERISEIVFDKGLYLLNFMEETAKSSVSQIRNLMIEQDSRDETSLNLFYSWAVYENNMVAHLGKKTFSEELFEHPDLLFVSEIITDDVAQKIVKIMIRLLPILLLNMLLIVVSVVRFERLDIR